MELPYGPDCKQNPDRVLKIQIFRICPKMDQIRNLIAGKWINNVTKPPLYCLYRDCCMGIFMLRFLQKINNSWSYYIEIS